MYLKYPAMPPLPVELVSAIIEYFFGERDELGRLALVSKTWAVQSRRLLLRCVRLKVTAEHDAVDAFARFLDAPLGSLSRAHIRHVIVQGIPPDDDADDEPTVAVHALGEMLVKVPRVASIELHVVKFRGVEAEDPDPPVVWHVQWVHLARVSTWMAHDLKNTMDVLRLFPNLQTFQTCNGRDSPIRDTTADVERPYILPLKRRPFPDIKLTSLRHKIYGPTAPLFDYLARDFDLRYLTTLVLWHIDSWELPSLGKVLAQAKTTLKRFELNLSEVRFWKDRLPKLNPRKEWPKVGLQDCKVLEVVCIFVPLDDDPEMPGPGSYRPYWDSAEAICSVLPPSVRRIYFGIEVVKEPEWQEEVLETVYWDHISRSLGNLPLLERVHCYQEYRWFEEPYLKLPDWIQDIVKEGLQGLYTRGLLKLDVPRRAGIAWRV